MNIMDKQQMQREIGTLTVVLLIVYVLSLFVNRSVIIFPIHIGPYSLNLNWKMIDLAAPAAGILGSLGLYQLVGLRSFSSQRDLLIQGVIPFAAAFSLGIALRNTSVGWTWWMMLFFGGLLLYLIFMAETIVRDPNDPSFVFAEVTLTGLSYATFLMTAVAVRANLDRLSLMLPVIALVGFLISKRIFSLRLYRVPSDYSAVGVTVLSVQAAAAFHYWPVNSLSFSVLLFLWYYVLINSIIYRSQGVPFRKAARRIGIPVALLFGLFLLVEFLN